MIRRWVVGILAIFALVHPSLAGAISSTDRHSVNFDSVFYDERDCSLSSSTNLTGSDNQQRAFNYFVQKGLTAEQSAGIVGNLVQESEVDPKSNQPDGPGRGIAQWSEGDRWDELLKYASSRGANAEDLGLQLDFMWYEMTSVSPWSSTLPALKATKTIEEATRVFEENYEKAGEPVMENRIKYAQAVFNNYATAEQKASEIAATVSDCYGVVGSGQNTKFIDGFIIYSQYDPAWKDRPYGTSTIGRSGCGPSAMAMIIVNLLGNGVTPVDTSNFAASQGLYIPGQGSSWSISPVLAAHWGLKSKPISPDVQQIAAALQAGGLVIAPGKGSLPFTSGGHFIVVRGITADGKFKVGDSGHSDTSDKEWDPQQLVSNMSDGVYAIYK